tara:strand:- start:119 stop:1225 length:1107 start_codon:yes stop_codon:yes gene_type:complete
MEEVTEPDIGKQLEALKRQLASTPAPKKKEHTFSPFCTWILDVHKIVLQSMIPGMKMDTETLANKIKEFEEEIEDLPCTLPPAKDQRHAILWQRIRVQDQAYKMIAFAVVSSWQRVYNLKQAYEERSRSRNLETDSTAQKWENWVKQQVLPSRRSTAPQHEDDATAPSNAQTTYYESHVDATQALEALDKVRRAMNEFWQHATTDTPIHTLESLQQQETQLMQAAVEAVQYRTVARHRMLEEKHRAALPNFEMQDEGVDMEDIELLKMQILGTINDEKLRRKAFRYQEIREMVTNAVMYELSRVQKSVCILYQSMLIQMQACDDDLNIIEQNMARKKKEITPLPDCEYSMELQRRQDVFRTIKSHQFT